MRLLMNDNSAKAEKSIMIDVSYDAAPRRKNFQLLSPFQKTLPTPPIVTGQNRIIQRHESLTF